MPSNTFSVSAAMCLALAIGPASVLAAPQLNGLPLLGGDNTNAAPANGNSEHDAGAGYEVGLPGGPAVRYGAGTHSEHHGPCGPGPNGEHDAGAGFDVGIPGGPAVRFGAGTHDQYQAVPCPEPTTTTYAQVMIPPTYTTPIVIPTTTPAPVYVPQTPVPVYSKPLIPHPAPTASTMPSFSPSPSAQPVFNAGSSLAPSSLAALALPIILGMFY